MTGRARGGGDPGRRAGSRATRPTRSAPLILAAGLLGATVVAGCGSGGVGQSAPSPQTIYVSSLIADAGSLIPGVLEYTDVGPMRTGADTSLAVTVSGDKGYQVISGSPSGQPSPEGGTYTYPSVVYVGATIGVRLLCSGAITCTAESSERQNVLTPTDSQTWTWDLAAGSPGTATVTIVATTYDQNSDNVLAETRPISQTITVTSTSGYDWSRLAHWLQWLIGFVGAGAIFSAGTWIARRLRKRYAQKQQPDGPEPAEPKPEPEPAHPTPPESPATAESTVPTPDPGDETT
jgi:hypothetical protein